MIALCYQTCGMSIDVQRETPLSGRVAEEIRALMARRRMSGRELARRLDVSASWVSYRLTGSQPIDLNDLEQIARALDVKVIDLLPRDERPTLPTLTYPSRAPGHPPAGRPPGHPPAGHRRTAPTRPTAITSL